MTEDIRSPGERRLIFSPDLAIELRRQRASDTEMSFLLWAAVMTKGNGVARTDDKLLEIDHGFTLFQYWNRGGQLEITSDGPPGPGVGMIRLRARPRPKDGIATLSFSCGHYGEIMDYDLQQRLGTLRCRICNPYP